MTMSMYSSDRNNNGRTMEPRTSGILGISKSRPSMAVMSKSVEEYCRTKYHRGTLTSRAVSSVKKSYPDRLSSTKIRVPFSPSKELSPTFFVLNKKAGLSSPLGHPDEKENFEIRGAGHDNDNILSECSKDLLRRASNIIGQASLTLSASKKSDLLYSHDPICRGRVLFSGAQENISASLVSPLTHLESESRKRDPPASSDRKIIVKDPPGSVSETSGTSSTTDTISSFEQELLGKLVPLQPPYSNPYSHYPDPDIHLSIMSTEDSLVLPTAPVRINSGGWVFGEKSKGNDLSKKETTSRQGFQRLTRSRSMTSLRPRTSICNYPDPGIHLSVMSTEDSLVLPSAPLSYPYKGSLGINVSYEELSISEFSPNDSFSPSLSSKDGLFDARVNDSRSTLSAGTAVNRHKTFERKESGTLRGSAEHRSKTPQRGEISTPRTMSSSKDKLRNKGSTQRAGTKTRQHRESTTPGTRSDNDRLRDTRSIRREGSALNRPKTPLRSEMMSPRLTPGNNKLRVGFQTPIASDGVPVGLAARHPAKMQPPMSHPRMGGPGGNYVLDEPLPVPTLFSLFFGPCRPGKPVDVKDSDVFRSHVATPSTTAGSPGSVMHFPLSSPRNRLVEQERCSL